MNDPVVTEIGGFCAWYKKKCDGLYLWRAPIITQTAPNNYQVQMRRRDDPINLTLEQLRDLAQVVNAAVEAAKEAE